jgi:metal-dependent hydrolase (beta-lactamase superfamily II)
MGLKTLLERAEAAFDVPVAGVVGGLHYCSANAAALQGEIQLVQELGPVIVALSPHDSGPAALNAFAEAFPSAYQPIEVGARFTVPETTARK